MRSRFLLLFALLLVLAGAVHLCRFQVLSVGYHEGRVFALRFDRLTGRLHAFELIPDYQDIADR